MATLQEKFGIFKDWVLNQGEEIRDKNNLYQCMDLAFAWAMFLNAPKSTVSHLYAYQVYTAPDPTTTVYFDLIPNTPDFVPQVGDLAVFDKTATNIAGHVSVCTGEGNKISFYSLDQNWGGQSIVTQVEHNYDNPKLLGVLRPRIEAIAVELVQKMDLTSLDNNTALHEIYGVLEQQAIKSKFIAKDQWIADHTPQTGVATPVVPEGPTVTTTTPGGDQTNLVVTSNGTSIVPPTKNPSSNLITLIVGLWKSILAKLGNNGN